MEYYMAWWWEHHLDHIGIHAPNPAAEEEVIEEDTNGTQDGWNATNTRPGWDGRSDYEVWDASLDVGHDDNDEMDLDQDDYEPEITDELDDANEDDNDDDEDGKWFTLWFTWD